MNVTLDKTSVEVIEAAIESGQFATATEVVRQALAMMDVQRNLSADQIAYLREEVAVGIAQADSGEFEVFTADDVVTQGRAAMKARRESKGQ